MKFKTRKKDRKKVLPKKVIVLKTSKRTKVKTLTLSRPKVLTQNKPV